MAQVTDSIIAEFILKGVDQYVAGMGQVNKAHDAVDASLHRLAGNTFDIQKEGQKYKAGANERANAEEQAGAKIIRTRKAQADTAKSTADTEIAAAKRATEAQIAEAARLEAALTKSAQKRYYAQGPAIFEAKAAEYRAIAKAADEAAAATARLNAVEARTPIAITGGAIERSSNIRTAGEAGDRSAAGRQTDIMRQTRVEAEGQVAAETEINHLLLDQYDLRQKAAVAEGDRAGRWLPASVRAMLSAVRDHSCANCMVGGRIGALRRRADLRAQAGRPLGEVAAVIGGTPKLNLMTVPASRAGSVARSDVG